jgi:formylglycine-generating enzyme required for sulfatase activity
MQNRGLAMANRAGSNVSQEPVRWLRLLFDSRKVMKTEKSALFRSFLLLCCVLVVFGHNHAQGQELPAGSSFRDCAQCPEMIVIPAGAFLMGSSSEDAANADEQPQHEVSIANAFAVSRTEITFDQWNACSAADICVQGGSGGHGRGDLPVSNVSWNDAQAYVGWLNATTGEHYRLLSEAEFEYATRAGTTTPWFWGNAGASGKACEFANLFDQAGKGANPDSSTPALDCDDGYAQGAPVGTYKANPFGLADITGNLSEWVEDCYEAGYTDAPDDGSVRKREPPCEKKFEGICMDKFDSAAASGECEQRVVRGGSWADALSAARAASRRAESVGVRNDRIGFRVARGL